MRNYENFLSWSWNSRISYSRIFNSIENYTNINDEIGTFKYEIIAENENGTKFRYIHDGETIEPQDLEEKDIGIINSIMNYVNKILKVYNQDLIQ